MGACKGPPDTMRSGDGRVQSCIDKKGSAPHAHPPACGRGGALCAISPPVQRQAGRRGWFCRMRMHQGEQRPHGAHKAPLARGWRGASARTSEGAAAPVVLSARRLSVGRGGGRLPDNACSHPGRAPTLQARFSAQAPEVHHPFRAFGMQRTAPVSKDPALMTGASITISRQGQAPSSWAT
jgi:hypothetical protein